MVFILTYHVNQYIANYVGILRTKKEVGLAIEILRHVTPLVTSPSDLRRKHVR